MVWGRRAQTRNRSLFRSVLAQRDLLQSLQANEQLELTQAGRKVYRELVPLAKSFEAQLLARMDGEDAETLLVGLKALEKVALGRDRPEE
jgi:hypothetical protein